METVKHCSTCAYEHAVDRAECNSCAREWNASGYTRFINWEPKPMPLDAIAAAAIRRAVNGHQEAMREFVAAVSAMHAPGQRAAPVVLAAYRGDEDDRHHEGDEYDSADF